MLDKVVLNEACTYSHHDLNLLPSEVNQFVIAIDKMVGAGNRFFAAKLHVLLK